jgi:biotin carboxyl carrier protein
MMSPQVFIVTAEAGGKPYRVSLETDGGAGWSAVVEQGSRRWTFSLARGPSPGLAWCGDRPLRWHWDARAGRLVLDGVEHRLVVETEAEYRVAARPAAGPSRRVEDVRAPMPGLVVAVEVTEGQPVEAGQGLIVIEAMKMENEITAPAAGIVRALAVAPGEAVERGAPLCRLEPPDETRA